MTHIYKISALFALIFFSTIVGCNISLPFFGDKFEYSGQIDLQKYGFLEGRKIFIDPGHGSANFFDRIRTINSLSEGEVNLRVALILSDMLSQAGADVELSRKMSPDVPLSRRVKRAEAFKPDLLVSIHHNGTLRREDNVDFPGILIWGSRKVNPLSYKFAELLIDEFHRSSDKKGSVFCDFSVYKETGTKILRETVYLCPGVIGEFGFFTNPANEVNFRDILYNTLEAEAYFNAIAEFFKRGIPKAAVLVSTEIGRDTHMTNLLGGNRPVIAIKAESGTESVGIDKKSVKAALDGIPVKCSAQSDNVFFIDYGLKLFPGIHELRFYFKNLRDQPSMIYSCRFSVEIKKGDYDNLVKEGLRYIGIRKKRETGLRMLASALSMEPLSPEADKIIWNIAQGFAMNGDVLNAEYFYKKLYHFYPQSGIIKKINFKYKDYRFPVDFYGREIEMKHEPSLNEKKL